MMDLIETEFVSAKPLGRNLAQEAYAAVIEKAKEEKKEQEGKEKIVTICTGCKRDLWTKKNWDDPFLKVYKCVLHKTWYCENCIRNMGKLNIATCCRMYGTDCIYEPQNED